MPKEQFDENNFDHMYFHGSQEGLDKANARCKILEMLSNKEIDIAGKERMFKQIDKGEKEVIDSLLGDSQ